VRRGASERPGDIPSAIFSSELVCKQEQTVAGETCGLPRFISVVPTLALPISETPPEPHLPPHARQFPRPSSSSSSLGHPLAHRLPHRRGKRRWVILDPLVRSRWVRWGSPRVRRARGRRRSSGTRLGGQRCSVRSTSPDRGNVTCSTPRP
jgi:hypothetical protein